MFIIMCHVFVSFAKAGRGGSQFQGGAGGGGSLGAGPGQPGSSSSGGELSKILIS